MIIRFCSVYRSVVVVRGSANNWWLRSANSATNFANVNNNGNGNNNNASNAYGVVFGFYRGQSK